MKTALGALVLALIVAPALAGDPPIPKVFRGIAADKGQWRVDVLEAERDGRAPRAQMRAITLCTDNLLKPRARRGAARQNCDYRLETDTADEAVIESTCANRKSRVSLTREGAKSVLMQLESDAQGAITRMKMRYTYLGECREDQGAVTLDKASEACKRLRERAARIDPAKTCADSGERRAECEARTRAAVEQMSAMCR
jgi:hypothetical protein